MKWFKKHSVCKECGVHFDVVPASEAKWGDLCPTHRKPVMEMDRRRETVIHWATCNWQRLGEQMDAERMAERPAGEESRQAEMQSMAQMYAQAQAYGGMDQGLPLGRHPFGFYS